MRRFPASISRKAERDTDRIAQGKRKGQLIERAPATAGAAGIRVPNIETLAAKAIVEIDNATAEIFKTRGVHKKGDAVTLKHLVFVLLRIEGHAVLETGATARFNEYAEELTFSRLLGLKRTNLSDGFIG